MAREGSALSCGRMYRGSCVALWPRGGRGEMVDRANELELAAWRRGRGRSWMLLDDFGTSILRTFSAVHYHPRPRPRVVEARLVAELIFIWPILCPQWQCLFSDTRGRPSPSPVITWFAKVVAMLHTTRLAYLRSFQTPPVLRSISFVKLSRPKQLRPASQLQASWA